MQIKTIKKDSQVEYRYINNKQLNKIDDDDIQRYCPLSFLSPTEKHDFLNCYENITKIYTDI